MAGIVEDADNRPTTPEAGNNDPFTVNEDAELLVSFHGWDPIDSDQPPAVQSLLLGKDVNKEPPPLTQGQHNPLGGGVNGGGSVVCSGTFASYSGSP
jgi:hypothetical protein